MLTQHSSKLSLKSRFVNAAIITTAAVGAMSIAAPSAMAMSGYDTITTTEYKVSFAKSEIQTPEGTALVYRKLAKKAAKACSVGSNVDDNGKVISKAECTENLLSQFVKSAALPELSAMHAQKSGTLKSASMK